MPDPRTGQPPTAREMWMLRVFADDRGLYGNRLGVLDHDAGLTTQQMVCLTRALGLSETVQLGAALDRPVRIFNPIAELLFAGHPMVGVAWLLEQMGSQVERLLCGAGACEVTFGEGLTWVTAYTAWAPPWEFVEYDAPSEIDELVEAPPGHDFVQTWAWVDRAAGRVRARVFAPRVSIPEDEACGSASLLLADRLGSELVIEHGSGSLVYARPLGPGLAQVGGRVMLDEQRLVSAS